MAGEHFVGDVEERALKAELVRRARRKEGARDRFAPTKRERRLAEELRRTWFDKQAAFYRSEARRRVAFCSRRSGKTLGSAIWFLADMLEVPNGISLYIAQTAGVARIYMWKELRELVERWSLPISFNETNLVMKHKRGGGLLLLRGADKADEIEKLRGPKYRKICLDEAQSFGVWVEPLVNEVLGAALRDEGGELVLTGTAGKNKEGAFYEACHGLKKRRSGKPVYELHRWTLQDNPYLSELAKDEGEIIDDEGYSGPDDPRFLREYRGQWVIGDEERMFAFDERLNVYEGPLPTGHNFKTGFGCDFGWHDMTAFAVGMWAQTNNVFYVPETWGKRHQYTDDVAAKATEFGFKYDSRLFIGDTGGYGKNVAVHLARDYQINILCAQKREKFDHIAFFNSALRRGEVKVRRGDPVIRQLQEVAWNATRTGAANHSRDDLVFALLYIWRFAKNHGLGKVAQPKERKLDAGTAFAVREKQEALRAPRDDGKPAPAWVIGDTGAAANSARYCSDAWRVLLGNR